MKQTQTCTINVKQITETNLNMYYHCQTIN